MFTTMSIENCEKVTKWLSKAEAASSYVNIKRFVGSDKIASVSRPAFMPPPAALALVSEQQRSVPVEHEAECSRCMMQSGRIKHSGWCNRIGAATEIGVGWCCNYQCYVTVIGLHEHVGHSNWGSFLIDQSLTERRPPPSHCTSFPKSSFTSIIFPPYFPICQSEF